VCAAAFAFEDCALIISQNSKVILGLSSEFPFSLDAFPVRYPLPSQHLWDNSQFLGDPNLEEEDDEDEHPQIFLLSGMGRV
jgi:hypothetical protein